MAEYSSVGLARIGPSTLRAHTLRDLTSQSAEESFVRSFAYPTGPAYDLLLDRYAPAWRHW